MQGDPAAPTLAAREVLRLLKQHHNVLISGPPGIGKSRLLNEVARWFRASGKPRHDPGAPIPLPDGVVISPEEAEDWLPSPDRSRREVFSTAFHPGSKYRDFLRGLVPKADGGGFVVRSGTLYRASELGRTVDGVALVIIDEINRGPAVQVFGDAIVALESDKRLDYEGRETPTTQYFELLDDRGELAPYAFPHHLYVLAAMNQADTSVEPLDVAFLRRFEPYRLEPDPAVLREYFGLPDDLEVPDVPTEPKHVFAAATRAWEQTNRRITLGRGAEFQIGHGVFMSRPLPDTASDPTTAVADALRFVAAPWRRIRAHVDEVFFGHTRGIGAVLNVGAAGHPLSLAETYFAGEPVATLTGTVDDLYAFLRAVAADDAD